jgi:hypothetical protein
MLYVGWCPFKFQFNKLAGLNFSSRDCLSLVWTLIRVRWRYHEPDCRTKIKMVQK